MKQPSIQTIRRLKRRAITIHRKAEAVMSEIMAAYGEDGLVSGPRSEIMSDLSDNLLHMAEELVDALNRAEAWSAPATQRASRQ